MGEIKHGLLHTATLSFNSESNFQVASVLDKAVRRVQGRVHIYQDRDVCRGRLKSTQAMAGLRCELLR